MNTILLAHSEKVVKQDRVFFSEVEEFLIERCTVHIPQHKAQSYQTILFKHQR